MGNFFTSTQFYNNENLNQKQFIEKFCKKMNEDGYVVCNDNESDLSYIMRFADNCHWVTITSKDYDESVISARKETIRIAKMFGTTGIIISVIDSDCAVMDLYSADGKKADTLIMGRADDYFGDNIQQPSEDVWKPFLANGITWEQFIEIVKGDYVFVDDGLSELAPVIGMDERNISFSAAESTENEHTVFLGFKKVEGKKEKKITPKEAFKQVFGEVLEPLGYIYAKTKMPSFLRMINGDIVNIISLYDNTETLSVNAGIFTLYREKINLNNHRWDDLWFKKTGWFLAAAESNPNNRRNKNNCFYSYNKNDSSSIYSALNTLLSEVKESVLKIFDTVKNLKDFVNYQILMNKSPEYFAVCDKINPKSFAPCSEGAMVFALDDPFWVPKTAKEQGLIQMQYRLDHKVDDITIEQYEIMIKRINDRYKKAYELISYVMDNPEFYEQTKQELERRKNENLKILKKYGINIEKEKCNEEKNIYN